MTSAALQPEHAMCARYFGMGAELYRPMSRLLQWLLGDEVGLAALRRIAGLTIRERNVPAAVAVFQALRAHVAAFYPLPEEGKDVALAAVMTYCLPKTVQNMHAMGVPDDVAEATLRDFSIWADVYRKKTGRPGIGETAWNLLFLTGGILRIGRLQYESFTFLEPYYVYRRRSEGDITVLTAGGVHVSAEGLPMPAAGGPGSFITYMRADAGIVTGNRVDLRQGVIGKDLVGLRIADHDLLLAPGMPAINMHIPADGPLTPQLVDDSIAQASPLLKRLGRHTPLGVCESWLLDPALDGITAPESNICRFMHRFRKFPNPTPGSAIVERVCGWDADKLAIRDLPERTSLQRALKQYLLNGGTVRDVSGVVAL